MCYIIRYFVILYFYIMRMVPVIVNKIYRFIHEINTTLFVDTNFCDDLMTIVVRNLTFKCFSVFCETRVTKTMRVQKFTLYYCVRFRCSFYYENLNTFKHTRLQTNEMTNTYRICLCIVVCMCKCSRCRLLNKYSPDVSNAACSWI